MGKKKKKNKHAEREFYGIDIFGNYEKPKKKDGDKKKTKKEFADAIDGIQYYQMRIFEADKRQNRRDVRRINKKEADFYTDMESIKCRKKIAKEWGKTGFIDRLLEILSEVAPIIKSIAKLICRLIVSFLSIDAIKRAISPRLLSKICKLFDIAMVI